MGYIPTCPLNVQWSKPNPMHPRIFGISLNLMAWWIYPQPDQQSGHTLTWLFHPQLSHASSGGTLQCVWSKHERWDFLQGQLQTDCQPVMMWELELESQCHERYELRTIIISQSESLPCTQLWYLTGQGSAASLLTMWLWPHKKWMHNWKQTSRNLGHQPNPNWKSLPNHV